jgi:prophage tail gpP-like protein
MSRSPLDVVKVCALGVPGDVENTDFNFDRWQSFTLRNSITSPAEACFELGDDTGYDRLSYLCQLGAVFKVIVDDRPRLTGRIEALSSTSDARQSTNQSFTIRTKLSDALYSSAPQGIRLKGASIKDFVLACYDGIGLGHESDFVFEADVSRDLMTGKDSRGHRPAKPLEPLKEEQAKVNPPETIFAAVDRHLRRHGYLHWDSPDGRIVVGAPDDTQEPLGGFRLLRYPSGQFNNVQSIERSQDVSQSPTVLGVFGIGGGRDFSKTKIAQVLHNQDLIDRGFKRRVVIVDEALKTKGLATSRANREFALRNRSLDRLTVKVDGLSYREGSELLPWSPDTTMDVLAEPLGGALGIYYVEEVDLSRNGGEGDTAMLQLVKQGVWVL